MNNICRNNLFVLIDELIQYEISKGITFNDDGFPIFQKWMFSESVPSLMIPYTHRRDTNNKSIISICFYEHDAILSRKLSIKKLEEISIELRKYHSFVGYDLSIFSDYLYPFQQFYILANLVIDIFFILKGNKMIPNLRADQTEGKSYFHLFNKAPIVCCGTLGCSKFKKLKDCNRNLITKYAHTHSHQIIIQYGSALAKENNTICFKNYGRRSKL